MKKIIIAIAAVFVLTLMSVACQGATENSENNSVTTATVTTVAEKGNYMTITQDEAKQIMDTSTGYVILDVREQDEYDQGHIPGAILIPYTQIEEEAPCKLTDKTQLILVYCRSGRRSKIAAQTLADMGYTNVLEFGGILDWEYDIE